MNTDEYREKHWVGSKIDILIKKNHFFMIFDKETYVTHRQDVLLFYDYSQDIVYTYSVG